MYYFRVQYIWSPYIPPPGEAVAVQGPELWLDGHNNENQSPELLELEGVEEGEGREPVTVFPAGVCLKIFEKLEGEPSDLLNCMEVCGLFRKLLRRTQPTWLFCEIFPHLFDYLEKKEILACRGTGRAWNKAVDNYIEEHCQPRPFNPATSNPGEILDTTQDPADSRMTAKGFRNIDFRATSEVIKLMETVGTRTRNPFIGRSLCVYDNIELPGHEGTPVEFWSAVFRFLDEYGGHIWYFNMGAVVMCRDGPHVNGRLLYLLRGVLSRLPNMRRLHLRITVFIYGSIPPDLRDNMENVRDRKLPPYLKRHPLPIVPSLETLDLHLSSRETDTIFQHLVARHGEQLKRFSFKSLNPLTLKGGLPTLTEFHWNLDLESSNLDHVETILSRLNSPLGKLKLYIRTQEDSLDLGRLFRLISDNFGGTLRILDLDVWPWLSDMAFDVDHPGQLDVNASVELGTPHLEALHLAGNCFEQLRIDFLLDVSSSLQYLELKHMAGAHRVPPEEEEVLDIYEYMLGGRLYESNVWSRMPKLKGLWAEFVDTEGDEVRWSYKRDMYEFLGRGGDN